MGKFFAPPKAIARLPDQKMAKAYHRYRLQVMGSIFLGYAAYYLVRKNFSIAKPYLMQELGLSTTEIGLIASGLSIAYGISKFVMGTVSDRSNARFFLATGLFLSAIINLFYGFLPQLVELNLFSSIQAPAWATMFGSPLIFILTITWFANGWFQGMGWPPCGRILTHWFSDRERGTKFAIWNVAHNIGGGIVGPLCSLGLILTASWVSIFYFPALLAIIAALIVLIFLRDNPQSVGLPPIEEFTNDYPPTKVDDRERELTTKEILFQFVLNNKFLWIIAFANCFIYIVRYGVLDWAPTYLTTVKHYPPDLSRWQFFLYEYAGIPGTLLSGWVSDRFFYGRRAPVNVIYMLLVMVAIFIYWQNPPGHYLIDSLALFSIGFLIYGPVMMIGVAAVDLVPKKAAGTAAGLTGLFGYFAGATLAELGIGWAVDLYGWDAGFYILLISAFLATLLMAMTWNVHNRHQK